MNNAYARAYTEVLQILKYLPEEELKKIPKEKIEFYEKNKDNEYNYIFDEEKSLEEQNISIEANSIIITLFRDYFATPIQREKLEKILEQNEQKYQKELREKYNPDNIFKKSNKKSEEEKIIQNEANMIEYKETFFKKIINKIKNIFQKNKKTERIRHK